MFELKRFYFIFSQLKIITKNNKILNRYSKNQGRDEMFLCQIKLYVVWYILILNYNKYF